jgi:magnesium chelatase subunit I
MKFNTEEISKIQTLGELKRRGYQPTSIKQELRNNLIFKLKNKLPVFQGIYGYEDTVIPDMQRAVLSMHNINLLGLRGQAKTRMARMMVDLLDDYIPIIAGTELNDDPLQPLSHFGREIVAKLGDQTPITWLHKDDRYTEKLATPDVSIADLIGDVDPIKAATLKLPYSDERVLHFGLIPRSHRCLFVINELPDLQPRIQVALFNILQEGDIQIRGFKLRLPLDIQFVFTANPEDYTNRGSIVTPLKDRIESQIITHYPKDISTGRQITEQEADVKPEQKAGIEVFELVKDLIEQIAIEARKSEFVDAKSGVSARLTIAAYENLLSAAERRMLINGESKTSTRIGDFWGVVPAISGKVELVYEGEQEGAGIVALNLLGKAIRTLFVKYFADPEKEKKQKHTTYKKIIDWFGNGETLDLLNDNTNQQYADSLYAISGLYDVIQAKFPTMSDTEKLFMMEFLLHGLAEYSILSKRMLERGLQFKDILSGMFNPNSSFDMDNDEDEDFGSKPPKRKK